jgi:Flp pilus assembly protein TadD
MGAVAVVLLVLGVLTLNQAAVWHDPLALWDHSVKSGIATPAVRVNYGLNLEREGRPDEAVEQFRLAAKDRPEDGRAWNVLANTLKRMKRFDEADAAYVQAEKFLPQKYMALMNHGQMLMRLPGREADGLARLREAVADIQRPGSGGGRRVSGVPYLVLGSVLWNRGDHDEARAVLRKALDAEDSREEAIKQLKAIGETP